jgi:hypothetical protein
MSTPTAIRIIVLHKVDGTLKRYFSSHVPRQGEGIEINNNTYRIHEVVWSPDMLHVRLMVDDLKN